jgi:hypothetical protein
MKETKPKIQFCFAITTTDGYGQTIQIFKMKKCAEEFYKKLLKIYDKPNKK